MLACTLALAAASWAQAPEARRAAIEQKLKLVESVMASQRVKQVGAGSDVEAKAQIAKAQQLLDAARAALAANDLDQAGPALDQALRAVSLSTARSAPRADGGGGGEGPNINLAALRVRHAELSEQVRSYRASLADARKNPATAGAAGTAIDKVDRLAADAERHAGGGRYDEANKLLGEAYMTAITALSGMSAGQTVVLSLKFDTPADEYAYEQKRNQSHQMMVDMMVQEGRADGQKKLLVDRFGEENRKLTVQAEKEAKDGNYTAAIKTMEQATQQLIRALQTVGVPVF